MRVGQAKELFRALTQQYFGGANVVFANQSRTAKQKEPLVVLTPGNVHRPQAPNYTFVDGEVVGHYLSRFSITVDLFTNGSPVVDEVSGKVVAYEDNAVDDMLSFADFLNSEHTVQWSHQNDVSILIDGDVLNLTGVVNDTSYEFRSRLTVQFYFTQKAVGASTALLESSLQYPTGEKDPETQEPTYTPMEAINKSFAKGYVDSETISQLLERSPEAVELLNKKLGTTSDKLEEMASSRTMTVADLKAAFVDNASIIEQKFGGVQYRITDALTVIRSEWGLWLTQMDSTLGVTNTIANAMVKFSDTAMRVMNRVRNAVQWLSDKLGGSEKLLKLLTITVGAFLIASKADKVIGFLKNAGSLLGKLKTGLGAINLKVVAIAAAIIILALLIEDFVNFMQGNDSLLGSMLEKAGIDADKVRETIQNAFQKVKDFLITAWGVIKTVLTTVWNVLKTVATSVFGGLQRFWEKHGEQIMTALANIWTGIKDRLILVWNIIKTVAMVVFGALKKFWDTWGESILTAFEAVWNVIKAVFGTAFDVLADLFAAFSALFAGDWEGFWENIKQYFADLWNGILNILGTILTGIWNVVSSVWSKIWEIVSNIATGIWESVTTAFTNMWNGVTTTVGNIKQSIVDGFTAAIDWIKSLPAQALQWGADIINNIVEGIKGAVGKVGEAVSGVAGKIKGFLGFSEPDEGPLSDFHTYMPDMIALMTKGISAGKAKVRDALGALTGDMSIMAQANVASPTTARTAMGSNSVSKSVVQNVNINNKFEGDRAGQQKSAAAMDKAAGDSTGEMARALAYAR